MIKITIYSLLISISIISILIFIRKNNINRFLLVNSITSISVVMIILIGIDSKNYYIIDIAIIYIILGCAGSWSIISYYTKIEEQERKDFADEDQNQDLFLNQK